MGVHRYLKAAICQASLTPMNIFFYVIASYLDTYGYIEIKH